MSVRNFADRLKEAVEKKNSRLAVGIDPDVELLPQQAKGPTPEKRVDRFCRAVLEAVATEAPVAKFQSAFYERLGPAGIKILGEHLRFAEELGLITILDAKRSDVGHTARAYADAYLGPDAALPADALTVSPYVGKDGLEPFARAARKTGRGVFVLVKTSNPGAADFQDAGTAEGPVYERVARAVAALGNADVGEHGYSSVGAVVGATYPGLITRLREIMPRQVFLMPGVGAQGGTPELLGPAFDEEGFGALVVAARSVIFAYRERGGDYAAAAREAAAALRENINRTALGPRP